MTGGKLYTRRPGQTIYFPIETGILDGNTVMSVRLMVRKPGGTSHEWAVSIHTKSATLVIAKRVTDGDDVTEAGLYRTCPWLYGAGAVLLGSAEELDSFTVEQSTVGPPS